MILLDTCVLSETVRPAPDPRVLTWFREQRGAGVFVSVLTLGELRNGLGRVPDGARKTALRAWIERFHDDFADRLLPVSSQIASRWGDLSAAAAGRGQQLAAIDGLIAATALEHGFAVATRNTRDFAVTGARLVNPWDAPTLPP